MAVFLLIAALGMIALAVYRFGRARGSYSQWRASVGVLRSTRSQALKSFGGGALLVIGAVLAVVLLVALSGHR
jgi:hypothetical protein